MAYIGSTFDPSTVPPAEPRTPIPAGEYPAVITETEVKPVKGKPGINRLSVKYTVIDGEHRGRTIYGNHNIGSDNEIARRIAQQELSAISAATGIKQAWSDSSILHNRPHLIIVAYVPENGQYAAKNEVRGWKALPATYVPPALPAASNAAPAHAAPPPAAALPTSSEPPWKRSA